MNKNNQELHVVVGRGALGKAVIQELKRKGKKVRNIVRAKDGWTHPNVETIIADVSNIEQAKQVFKNADTIYQCSQPAYTKWPELFPDLIQGIIEGAAFNRAKLIVGENLYMYGEVLEPIHEALPYNAITRKGGVRAKVAENLMMAHTSGKVKVSIGRAADFFGPHVLNSAVGERLFNRLVAGKKVVYAGDLDELHTYSFIEDFGKALVILGENEHALGEVWHIPNAKTVTTRKFIELAFHTIKKSPKLGTMGIGMMRFGGLFIPEAKESIEMMYQFNKPFVVDSSKFINQFGDISTPLNEALVKTVEWYLQRRH